MLVINGKTTVGKDTVMRELCRNHGYNNITLYTTRPMRPGEVNHREYHFVDDTKFDEMIDADEFVEYQTYETNQGTWRYGIPSSEFNNAGEKDIIILSARSLKFLTEHNCFGEDDLIFHITTSDEIIQQRIQMRGGDLVEAQRRVKSDDADYEDIEKYVDYVITQTETTSPYKICECIMDVVRLHEKWSGIMKIAKLIYLNI